MENTKCCKRCNEIKSIDQFYNNKEMKDGHISFCIPCYAIKAKERNKLIYANPEAREKVRKLHRETYYRLNYKDKYRNDPEYQKQKNKEHFERYPEKKAIRSLSNNKKAIKGIDRHHWSYNIEHSKEIILLTPKNHKFIHRFLAYDQELKMYRIESTGELIDSKEKHQLFIDNLLLGLQ